MKHSTQIRTLPITCAAMQVAPTTTPFCASAREEVMTTSCCRARQLIPELNASVKGQYDQLAS